MYLCQCDIGNFVIELVKSDNNALASVKLLLGYVSVAVAKFNLTSICLIAGSLSLDRRITCAFIQLCQCSV